MTWQRYWKKTPKKRNVGKKGERGPQIKTQIKNRKNHEINEKKEYDPLTCPDLSEATKKIWKERTDMNKEIKNKKHTNLVRYVTASLI